MNIRSRERLNVTIGKNVREARISLGWKQTELAERTKVVDPENPLSRATIAKIESYNATNISSATLETIALTFGVPAYMFMLCSIDWRNLAEVASLGLALANPEKIADPDTVEKIEAFSKSEIKQEKELATEETMSIVRKINRPKGASSDAAKAPNEQSKTVGTRMAQAMIPSLPIINGLIADLLAR